MNRMKRRIVLLLFAAFFILPPFSLAQESWTGGIVAADHMVASLAGIEMLEAGGNAIDAAVATGFCLSVVRPYSCGIGGGGFLILHRNEPVSEGTDYVYCHRERAPRAVGPEHFEDLNDSLASCFSGHAVGVPGTVAGLLHALDEHGTLDRNRVLAPAIRAAENGFAVDAHYALAAEGVTAWYEENQSRKETYSFVWERFLRSGSVSVGDTIRIPEQAEALRLIARDGAAAFYEGPVADAILETVSRWGGVMTDTDLSGYTAEVTSPLTGSFMDKTILTMPPPSSGGIAILQTLGILEATGIDLEAMRPLSAQWIHLVSEATKHAFADRAEWLGDASFVDVPVERLLDADYLSERADLVKAGRALKTEEYGSAAPPPDDGGTSHYSIIDRWGNAVSGTETINLYFGSRIAVEKYGFVLNNEMDDFLTRRGEPNAFGLRQSERNLPAPGKRPLSSMTPTIVLDKEGVFAIAGSCGGPRIISATLQSLLDVILFDMGAEEAVRTPRFHHQWLPDILYLERGIDSSIQMGLFGKGHTMERSEGIGNVQLIRRTTEGYQAACDPRKGGAPAGR